MSENVSARVSGTVHAPRMSTEQLELPCLPLPRVGASKGMPLAQPVPHRKVGSLLRFDIAVVDAWMDTLRRGPDPGSAA